MKIVTALLVVALIIFGGYMLFGNDTEVTPDESQKTYTSEKYGVSFEYPDTYFVTERLAPGSGMREHFTVMLVEDTDFNRRLIAGEILGTEGPVSINFEIYQNNLDNQSLNAWLTGSNESNFKLSDESLASTTVGGKEAVSYTWDGLYRGDTTAFVHGNYIVAATVTYHTPEDQIRKDYEEILETVELK